MGQIKRSYVWLWALFVQIACAIDVDWSSPDSVKAAASTIAYGMMSYYKGNESGQIPGLLPGPYYWWEAGAMFGSLVSYWHYTGDTTYNQVTIDAMQFQVGPHNDFMPPNQTASLGNDDQAFWGMAALAAAEYNFPNPPATGPGWLELAQAVFNEQISRWDTQYCNGGIRWQIYPTNTGYDLKNTISNGCLFNIASRLARYTGDPTGIYSSWAVKLWDWMEQIGLIDDEYNVYDSSEADRLNCSQIGRNQWTYNAGTLLMGASTMYNFTNGSALWQNRTAGLLDTIAFDFFPNDTMKDICEEYNACDVDQRSFKAYLSRWMAASTQMAPFTYNQSYHLLLSSAKAAAAQCNGAPTGQVCGLKWYLNGTWDGTSGVGQQMAALEVILGTMIDPANVTQAPLTNATGGTSPSVPSAGYNASDIPPGSILPPATHGDEAGGWILTAIVSVLALWMWVFMSTGLFEDGKATVGGKKKKRRPISLARALERNSAALDLSEKEKGPEITIMSPSTTIITPSGHQRTDSLRLNSIGEDVTGPAPVHIRVIDR